MMLTLILLSTIWGIILIGAISIITQARNNYWAVWHQVVSDASQQQAEAQAKAQAEAAMQARSTKNAS